MRHIGRPALSTQHLIFNLFGDYLAAPGQAVATAGLRPRLSWLGYGPLQPGTLIAASPRTQEVQRLLRELEVHPYVHVFAGARLDPAEQDRVVARCWDLPAIDARYAAFVDRYASLLRETRSRQQPD